MPDPTEQPPSVEIEDDANDAAASASLTPTTQSRLTPSRRIAGEPDESSADFTMTADHTEQGNKPEPSADVPNDDASTDAADNTLHSEATSTATVDAASTQQPADEDNTEFVHSSESAPVTQADGTPAEVTDLTTMTDDLHVGDGDDDDELDADLDEPETKQQDDEQSDKLDQQLIPSHTSSNDINPSPAPNQPPSPTTNNNNGTNYTLGTQLPIFANEENKHLEKQVQLKQQHLQQTLDEHQTLTKRIALLQQHIVNIQAELKHTEQLIQAKQTDVNAEQHLTLLAKREAETYVRDMKMTTTHEQQVQDGIQRLQHNKFTVNEELLKFRSQMKWNEQELLQWSIAQKQKEQDSSVLHTYLVEDNEMIKQLIKKSEKLNQNLTQQKQQLHEAEMNTTSTQIELNTIAISYEQGFKDKQRVIENWDLSQQQLKSRNALQMSLNEQLATNEQQQRQMEVIIRNENQSLHQSKLESKQVQLQIEDNERTLESRRAKIADTKVEVSEVQNLINENQYRLQKLSGEIRVAKQQHEALQKRVIAENERVVKIKSEVTLLKHQVEDQRTESQTLSTVIDGSEVAYQQSEVDLKRLTAEQTKLQQTTQTAIQSLYDLKQQETQVLRDIQGLENKNRNLHAKVHELEAKYQKQQEILYHLNYTHNALEQQVNREVKGKRTVTETAALKEKIEKLKDEQYVTVQTSTQLQASYKHLQTELKHATHQSTTLHCQHAAYKEQMIEMDLIISSTQQDHSKFNKQKNELLLQLNLLHLQVVKLKESLHTKAQAIRSLQRERIGLEQSMRLKDSQVQEHLEQQKSIIKHLEEGRSTLARELRERQTRVQKLQAKYEITAIKLSGALSEGESLGSEEKNQAYFIIAAAQERESMTREGDQLNQAIAEKEREIAALANTQQLLVGRNNVLKAGLSQLPKNSAEYAELEALEAQQRAALDALYKQRAYHRDLQRDIEDKQQLLVDIQNNVETLKQVVTQKEKVVSGLNKQCTDQQAAFERANNHCAKLGSQYKRSNQYDEVQDLEMKLHDQRKKYKSLVEVLRNYVESCDDIVMATSAANMDGNSTSVLHSIGFDALKRPTSTASSVYSSTGGLRSYAPSAASSRPSTAGRSRPSSTHSVISNTPSLPPINTHNNSRPSSNRSDKSSASVRMQQPRTSRPPSGLALTGARIITGR